MKEREVETFREEEGLRGDGPYRERFVLRSGIPDRADITLPLARSVERGAAVVSLSWKTGTERHGNGSVLPCMTPDAARRLAWSLLDAADDADDEAARAAEKAATADLQESKE